MACKALPVFSMLYYCPCSLFISQVFLVCSEGKVSACNPGDLGLIPGLGRSPEGGNGNPLQYSCLGNPMDRGDWQATVQRVTQSRTQLSVHT